MSATLDAPPRTGPTPAQCRPGLGYADWWAVGIVVLSAIALRIVFGAHAPVFFEGDARGYFVRAVEIAGGEGLNFTLKRTPGYSLLIAGVFGVAGRDLDAVVAAQHALGVGTALLAFLCGRKLAGWPAGLAAGLATGLSGSSLIYERVILTESVFAFLLMASIWLLLAGLERRSVGWLAAAGLVAGLGAMVRPVGLVLLPALPLLCLVVLPRRRAMFAGAAFAAAFGVLLAPWMLRNALVHGEATPVHPGRFLIERTVKRNQTGVSMYAGRGDPNEPELLRQGRGVVRAIEPEGPNSFEIHSALVRRLRLDDAQASKLMWDLAVDAIRRRPGAYLYGTWLELVDVVRGRDETVRLHMDLRRSAWRGGELERVLTPDELNTILPRSLPDEARRVAVAEATAHLYQPSGAILLLLVGSALAALWSVRDPSRRAVLIPLGAAAALLFCSVAILGAVPRYRYPLDPLLHVCAAAGLAWAVAAVRTRWHRRSAFAPAASA